MVMQEPAEATTLTFAFINQRLDAFAKLTDTRPAGQLERWALGTGALGVVTAILLGWLLPEPYATYVVLAGLAIEILGFSLGIGLGLKREWRSLRHARRDLAESLDTDLALYDQFVSELRRFPAEHRARMHRYVADRSQRMLHRIRLFAGGLERLGILPLLLAFYLQFKDWRFGDWAALSDVTFTQGILIFFLVGSYVLVWHLVYLQARTEALGEMLAEAAARDAEGSAMLQCNNEQPLAPAIS